MAQRRLTIMTAAAAACAVAGSLLVGAPAVTASTEPGMVVSWTRSPIVEQVPCRGLRICPPPRVNSVNSVVFRATASMAESEIIVIREGETLVVREVEGGPSLGVDAAATGACVANNPSGRSDEVRCTIPGATSRERFVASGNFSSAPRGITFAIAPGSLVSARVVGSAFSDYLQGGPLNDTFNAGDGDDFVYGGPGNDVIYGGAGNDILYGDGEYDEAGEFSEAGDDVIYGGPGDDFIVGGAGTDNMYGGPGDDFIDAKDGRSDLVVCNERATDPPPSRAPVYDTGRDNVINCKVSVEIPTATTSTLVSPTTLVKPGTTLTATAPAWRGTTPMTFAFAWQTCRTSDYAGCKEVGKGTLDAQGRDTRTGKAPTYQVKPADRGLAVRFLATADNSKTRGGAAVTSESGFVTVEPVEQFKILDSYLPTQKGSSWSFAQANTIVQAVAKSKAAPYITVTQRGWQRGAVPSAMRKAIKDGQVFDVIVNGRSVKSGSGTVIEVDSGTRASIEIKYYSRLEDRNTCPAKDGDLAYLREFARKNLLDLSWFLTWINGAKCAWAITWAPEVTGAPVFTVKDLFLEETDDEDRPVQVRVIARGPSTSEQLALAVGAPPRDISAQSPQHLTIGAAGGVYAFPTTVFTAMWVSLVGDQARQPNLRAKVDLYVNGRLRMSGTQGAGNFSYNVGTHFLTRDAGGTARIVVTTLNDNGSARAQVYADIPIVDAATASLGELVTWDGRCFNRDGSRSSCAGRSLDSHVVTIRDTLAISGANDLRTRSLPESLWFASQTLDLRFTPIVVNGRVPGSLPGGRSAALPRSTCAWWDLLCHLRGAGRKAVPAKITPKPTPQRPRPAVQTEAIQVVTVPVAQGNSILAATRGLSAVVPGVGVTVLSGRGLLSDQGGSLLSDQGGSLLSDQGGSLLSDQGGSFSAVLRSADGRPLTSLPGATFHGPMASSAATARVDLNLLGK